ncbi:hypothetical protein G3T14_23615 [Methylobacterium sp. BTF04]|uniref:hypothetical protein n=1 Tax=Methylobacterium sp. BTF04 TaxID=2708300 RepID=UPI0013D3F599|nr:hypothetical protein [Methylobacterium sp. BTF04]NEU15033.1 hypothetical protein [Methylobacterium sp. BTF04]
MSKPHLDLRRLDRDLAKDAKRFDALAPGGKPATGLMAAVRDNLDALVALQASGVTWNAIAAGLTMQGFTTSDGRPLTGTQITGIVSSVRRQEIRRAAKAAVRLARGDLKPPPDQPVNERRLRLSPDLVAGADVQGRGDANLITTEEEIRRVRLSELQHLLKKP